MFTETHTYTQLHAHTCRRTDERALGYTYTDARTYLRTHTLARAHAPTHARTQTRSERQNDTLMAWLKPYPHTEP